MRKVIAETVATLVDWYLGVLVLIVAILIVAGIIH